MDESTKTSPCKEWQLGESDVQLQTEVVHLRQHLAERDTHIESLEENFSKCTAKVKDFEEQLTTWREKYERLYDSYKRVQKLNQILEDKLLQMVDKMKGEKCQLTKDIATLSVRLAESKHSISMLQKENERYKNDMNLAIQLLQCKPDNFVSQKLDNLPVDTQQRVSQYVMAKTKTPSQALPKNGNELESFDVNEYEFNISASLMSKILEDSIQDTVTKHCDTCTCSKSQNKPFAYNETHYTVATQTFLCGEMKNSLCLNCNSDMKSLHSNISHRSASPHAIKLVNEMSIAKTTPMYIVPQNPDIGNLGDGLYQYDECVDKPKLENENIQLNSIPRENIQLKDDVKKAMKPEVHHKLCERNSIKSGDKIDDLFHKDILPIKERDNNDSISLRKNSRSSTSAISRTSSLAKSTTSTHKSNTQVGPGPRFCSLRMQAGSKNILLDNAQPDVPPILYKRQTKSNENSIFRDLNDVVDDMDNIDKDKNIVVETTLIDVHVDSNSKDIMMPSTTNTSFNPVLLNVSSSPLLPQKTHSFSNGSENNNSSLQNNSNARYPHVPSCDLLNNIDGKDQEKNCLEIEKTGDIYIKNDFASPTDDHGVKLFNFDHYEQTKLSNLYSRPVRKIDMSQLHSIENTRISKDLPPQGDYAKIQKKISCLPKHPLPAIVNVYPNLTQTHLKVNTTKNTRTNEQSTSSLSSDDSAALLQKQQLLRVAEWVEQNLEQQNNLNDPLAMEDDINYDDKDKRRNSKLKLTDTLEMALSMPHPVSKYSKSFDRENDWVNSITFQKSDKTEKVLNDAPSAHNNAPIVKEINDKTISENEQGSSRKELSPEELARMEYNVKQFLLGGSQWVSSEYISRSRRTTSKTETDV